MFVLEIVLGVDNVMFISILASKLPVEQQAKARNLGLTLAMIIRDRACSFAASWIITPHRRSVRSVRQGLLRPGPHPDRRWTVPRLQGGQRDPPQARGRGGARRGRRKGTVTFGAIIIQILLLDIVFSFDSVITAVGMVDNLLVIIAGVVLSFG